MLQLVNQLEEKAMYEKLFFILSFILILVISRLIPHPPNFTPIIATAIFGPIFLNNKMYGAAITIIAMFISDIFISMHSYQFIIYATLISISLLTPVKKNKVSFAIFTFGSCVWFFLTTNFAVWVLWDYYPKNLEGLLLSYTLAIPFFTNTLVSTFLFVVIFWNLHTFFKKSNFVSYLRNMKTISFS